MASRSPTRIVRDYLRTAAAIARSGVGTREQSFYPPLNDLIGGLGARAEPAITPLAHPAGREGDLPDVACWEELSNVLALPVEVKSESVSPPDLLALPQARRYARSFGGSHVLVTNLKTFIWAELDANDVLHERDRVDLLSDGAGLADGPRALVDGAPDSLLDMLGAAWALRETMEDPIIVARLLAYHARQLEDQINEADNPAELLRPLTQTLHDGYGMELDERFLVGTVVQTLVYGVFAAWLEAEEPQGFRWRESAGALELDVFANLFHAVTSPALLRAANLDHHLSAIARVLNWVDRDAFDERFGSASVEYFYEPFLGAFDPELRDRLGVWYTPREIAEYQVRRVDHHLREELGLADGLADEQALVLDPACGTGTYLAAVLRAIYARHLENRESETTAARRTVRAAETRVVGFEILPAPFLVSHLHLHRVLTRELGARAEHRRLRVYLSNALMGWGGGPPPTVPLGGFEAELRDALQVKADEPVIAVLGNPPYQGYSAADTEEERELARPWIEPLWPRWRIRKHRLGDLYVRFWRIAVRKVTELTGRGVVSFISNRKWLGGRSFPAMREDILTRFQLIVVDDLGGDVRAGSGDGGGSVFTTQTATGIRVGVAIATAVRTGAPDQPHVADVLAREYRGTGVEKRVLLSQRSGPDLDAELEERHPQRAHGWKLSVVVEDAFAGLDEYMRWRRSGVQPVRDEAVTDYDREELLDRMRDYFDEGGLTWARLANRHPSFAVARARYDPPATRIRVLERSSFDESRLVEFLYRPYEIRWLYWQLEGKLLNEARAELDPVHRLPDQIYIVQAETPRRPRAGRPLVTRALPAFAAVDPDARAFPRVIPRVVEEGTLDLYPGEDNVASNVGADWLAAAREVGAEGTDLEVGDILFYGLIAVLHSPAWADAVPADQDDFPGVPLPRDSLAEAARLGREIAALADPLVEVDGVTRGRIDAAVRGIAEPHIDTGTHLTIGRRTSGIGGEWSDEHGGCVRWGGGEWRNVPQELWRYTAGGFPVLSKWLSYRIGHDLEPDHLEAFTMICRRLTVLLNREAICDELYVRATAAPLELAPPA